MKSNNMEHGLIAYGIQAGLINGDHMAPIGTVDEHIKNIFDILEPSEPRLLISDVNHYFTKLLPTAQHFNNLSSQNVAIALADMNIRFLPDTLDALHNKIVEIQRAVPVSRGSIDSFLELLASKKIAVV